MISAIGLVAFGLTAMQLYQQGSALFEKGQLPEAALRFAEASRLAPKDARVWKALGVSYAALGDYERANDPLERACSLDQKLEDACYFYGRNLYALNRFDLALKALQKGMQSTRYPWRVYLGIAQANEGLADASHAEPAFHKAVKLFEALPLNARGRPDFDPRVHLATFLYRQGRLDEALPFALKVTNEWPNHGRGYFELGRIQYQQGQLDPAASSLVKAVANGAGGPAHLLLGQVYRRLGRMEEAERHLAIGATSDPAP